LDAYDRLIGFDFSECAVDGSLHKAPAGGEGTGPNPTDRAKSGWKWSLLTERQGVPLGWTTGGANCNDSRLLEPTLAAVKSRGLLGEIETLHLDLGYDSRGVRDLVARFGIDDLVCARKRKAGRTAPKKPVSLGMRWPVERTNSWLSNFGQLRRNTDRQIVHRLAQLALAIVILVTAKLIDWRDRWSR
jgi:transposase